ncbi:hypothetical protein A4X13_0g3014 [Tilletia indica]|uniref:Scaffold protein Nfu/NifU N-terminal domain-containing protein n=1 Tax=Tilletia indica TaxID=43049 RepID=A0A177TXK4_9BASI|nr:hypothetical protein A4X13_0g3014 [Tilletia indica]
MIVQHTLRTAAVARRVGVVASARAVAVGSAPVAVSVIPTARAATATPSSSSSSFSTSSTSSSFQPISRVSPRPRLQQERLARQQQRRTMFIQTETTPNEDSLKFLPGQRVMENGTAEFLDNRSSMSSPLAKKLFSVPGVRSVFYGPDFVTVSKHSDMPWSTLKPEVFATLMDFFSSGLALFAEGDGSASQVAQDTLILDTDSETVAMIKELLDTRVRPAIQEDGGDIEYRGWTDPEEGGDGMVRVMLKGSCRGCDSSTVTLVSDRVCLARDEDTELELTLSPSTFASAPPLQKSGIERMLMHYIPEVRGVEQVLDQEDEIALDEFAKFESKLEKDRQRERERERGRGFSE